MSINPSSSSLSSPPPSSTTNSALGCTPDSSLFTQIRIHTAKCSICDKRNQATLRRCPACSYQICTPCYETKNGAPLYHGNMSVGDELPDAPARQVTFGSGPAGIFGNTSLFGSTTASTARTSGIQGHGSEGRDSAQGRRNPKKETGQDPSGLPSSSVPVKRMRAQPKPSASDAVLDENSDDEFDITPYVHDKRSRLHATTHNDIPAFTNFSRHAPAKVYTNALRSNTKEMDIDASQAAKNKQFRPTATSDRPKRATTGQKKGEPKAAARGQGRAPAAPKTIQVSSSRFVELARHDYQAQLREAGAKGCIDPIKRNPPIVQNVIGNRIQFPQRVGEYTDQKLYDLFRVGRGGYTEGNTPLHRMMPQIVAPPQLLIPERISRQTPRPRAPEIQANIQRRYEEIVQAQQGGTGTVSQSNRGWLDVVLTKEQNESEGTLTASPEPHDGCTVRQVVEGYAQSIQGTSNLDRDQQNYLIGHTLEAARKLMHEFHADAAPTIRQYVNYSLDLPHADLAEGQKARLGNVILGEGVAILHEYQREGAASARTIPRLENVESLKYEGQPPSN
ncbi:hypothetical protein GQ43DRAFT_428175 [Delitschia confertaspora ATCC 74209]|uniref:Uncharacterized protein n=1 Tax=Delitschia confertaspora ATCC 74209 TaxID=1513339 RepID=A0A9P4JZJ0_9PLEO|nr:hypothetical protein GQ43DRAFT_428175 [Delitschia confertaspora ATCC 74209]